MNIPARQNPSQIKNKAKRSQVYAKLKVQAAGSFDACPLLKPGPHIYQTGRAESTKESLYSSLPITPFPTAYEISVPVYGRCKRRRTSVSGFLRFRSERVPDPDHCV